MRTFPIKNWNGFASKFWRGESSSFFPDQDIAQSWTCKACNWKRPLISGASGREPEYFGMASWDCSWKETVCLFVSKPSSYFYSCLIKRAWSAILVPGNLLSVSLRKSQDELRLLHLVVFPKLLLVFELLSVAANIYKTHKIL